MSGVPAPAAPAKPPAAPYTWATGRRKSSIARVRIRPGTGVFQINERELKDYFPLEVMRQDIQSPLRAAGAQGKYDIFARMSGGGVYGQVGAIILGIARALAKVDPSLEPKLRDAHFLTRDPREKERKKPGKKGARASFQFSKR